MNINLTPIIQAFIALLAALVTYRLIPWIKSKTTESQQTNLRSFIKVLIYAAEQMYGPGNGKEKLSYVVDALKEAGYDVNLDEIEAAVAEYLNWDKFDPISAIESYMDIPPLAEWTLDQLKQFFAENDIPYDGEETKEEMISALKQEFLKKDPEKAPPDAE